MNSEDRQVYSVCILQFSCFTRCPQGLKNSPLYLKLLMDKLFGDMTDDVIHYADDILIATSGNFSQHLRVVDKALKRITNDCFCFTFFKQLFALIHGGIFTKLVFSELIL